MSHRQNNRSLTPRGREVRVSLGDDYDGRRVVNTPLSLHACQLEGVDPYSLTIAGRAASSGKDNEDENDNRSGGSKSPNRQAGAAAAQQQQQLRRSLQSLGSTAKGQADTLFDAAVPATKEQQEIKNRIMERRRQLLFASVLRTYKKLSSPRNTLPPPPLALRGELPDDVEDVVGGGGSLSPGSARRKKFASQPKSVTSTLRRLAAAGASGNDLDEAGDNGTKKALSSLSNATVLSEENSLEVARFFSKREHLTKKQWEANLKTELRDKEARELWQQQIRERSESMSARAKQRDEHLSQVQEHHNELQEQRRREVEERVQKERERAEAVLARKRQMQEEARERGLTRGDDQRLNALKTEQQRLNRIAEKTQEKADVQAEVNARRLQERQLHEFEAHLNSLLSRDTQLRAARASEYKKEVFNERVVVSNYRANKRREESNDKYHDAMVQRDAVHRMKEQIETFFSTLPKRPAEVTARFSTKGEIGGDLKVLPPPALAAAKKRENNNDFLSLTASSSPRTTNSSARSLLHSTTSSRNVNNDVLPQIEPPAWLAKEVQHLTNSQKQKRALLSTMRSTSNSGRTVVIRNGALNDEDEASANGEGRSGSARSVKRATHPRRWPYTAPESESKVAYPKWMYQSD